MTGSDLKLWSGLRHAQDIADFVCYEMNFIMELDGSQHISQTEHDTRRAEFFNSLGFEVLRFQTNLPLTDLQALLTCVDNRITDLTALAPIPAFPREGKE